MFRTRSHLYNLRMGEFGKELCQQDGNDLIKDLIRMISFVRRAWFLSLPVLFLAGCGIPKGYVGKTQPPEQIAELRAEQFSIERVDDIVVGDSSRGWPNRVALLPGKRSVIVRSREDRRSSGLSVGLGGGSGGVFGGVSVGVPIGSKKELERSWRLSFNAVAGHKYAVQSPADA